MEKYKNTAKEIRKRILGIARDAGRMATHLGPALSIADFLGVIYGGYMNVDPANPCDPNRDHFILSKGHAYSALYSALNLKGFFTEDELKENFMSDGGFLPAHPVKNIERGIDCSSGSLGMSLAFALGKAYALKKQGRDSRVYVVVGDGECNEGSVWEAMMAAPALKTGNLIVFIDQNGLQHDDATSDVIPLDIEAMVKACGWQTVSIDGNNVEEIVAALDNHDVSSEKPLAIIGHTVKGKGVSFMENDNAWHHAALKENLYNQAMEELQ